MSLSARRAWIEMVYLALIRYLVNVALRKESVDRNIGYFGCRGRYWVALRKESVDRNMTCLPLGTVSRKSLSARRAWIEIFSNPGSTTLILSLSARRAWIEILRGQGR